MAEQSGFFDAHLVNGEYDRVYLAESFAKYFASFIGNGVFGGKSNDLMVKQKETADMSVRVLSGQGWINGYWYENDDELSLAIDVADGVLNRIDLIVLRWNNSERVIRVAIKKGTPASSAAVPTLQRDADYYELKLAQIYIKAGATRITQADITDTRLSSDVCGLVTGVVEQLDTEEFGAQLISFIEQFKANVNSWLNDFKVQKNLEVSSLISGYEADADQLIAELREIVEGNEFTLLSEKVVNIFSRVVTLETKATEFMTDITKLQNQAIEHGTYKGCYYRNVGEEAEWLNPPNEPGIEYKTTERWSNKPVYQKIIYLGALSNKAVMSIQVDIEFDKVVSISGYAFDPDNNMSYPFPIILNGLTPIAVISGVEGNGAESYIGINVNEDLSAFSGYITIKYVKV